MVSLHQLRLPVPLTFQTFDQHPISWSLHHAFSALIYPLPVAQRTRHNQTAHAPDRNQRQQRCISSRRLACSSDSRSVSVSSRFHSPYRSQHQTHSCKQPRGTSTNNLPGTGQNGVFAFVFAVVEMKGLRMSVTCTCSILRFQHPDGVDWRNAKQVPQSHRSHTTRGDLNARKSLDPCTIR